jgi:hypothetical protein
VAAELPIRWVRDTGVVHSASADVSDKGLFFRSTELVKVGELLQFEFEMPDGPMRLLVTVRHISSDPARPGFGVSLYAENTSSAKRWEKFCAGLIGSKAG